MTLLKFLITCCLLIITSSQETQGAVPHQLKDVCPEYLNGNSSIPCTILDKTCYCFSIDVKVSWNIANSICEKGNMTLVSIESQLENDIIVQYVKTTNPHPVIDARYWLAGKCSSGSSNSVWQWIPGGQSLCYSNFINDGQSVCLSEGTCLYLVRSVFDEWTWAGFACGAYYHFICEQDVNVNVNCSIPLATSEPVLNDSVPLAAIIIGLAITLIILVIVSGLMGFYTKSRSSAKIQA